jgi:DNA-binding NarL/FixJ family response regulator
VKLLIVEDEALLARCLTVQVKELGHSVCGTAQDEHCAVTMGTDHKPDVVLMDLRLAKGTCGARAARKLYELHHIRCIFVSGSLDSATRNALAAVNPVGFVDKPVRPHDLKRALLAVCAE